MTKFLEPIRDASEDVSHSDARLIFLLMLITKSDCAAYAQGYEGCTD